MNINPAAVDALSAVEGIAATIAVDAISTPQANPVAAPPANTAIAPQVANPVVAAPQANIAAATAVAPQVANPAAAGIAPQAANPAAAVAPQASNPAAAGVAPQANAPPALPSFNNVSVATATAAAAPAQGNTTSIQSYEIEGISNIEPHVQRHATAFYDIIIPLFEAADDTYKIMDRVKYYRIMGALQRARDGEYLSSLRAEFRQIHQQTRLPQDHRTTMTLPVTVTKT
jgi:hypothetical protein